MSEIEERVKRAIIEACWTNGPNSWEDRAATAAIKAMREPTQNMVDAVRFGIWDDSTPGECWRAMIDAAFS